MKTRNKFILERNNIYFFSDAHRNHSNILKMSNRGHSTVEEMNTWLDENIWGKLEPGDILFDLGDTFWKTDNNTIENILKKVPEDVQLWKIMGNHDAYGLYYSDQSPITDYYCGISDILDITVRYKSIDYMITLCHYPMVSWNHKPYGSFMLHGHCHGNIDDFNNQTPDLRLDVGVDGALCQYLGKPMLEFRDILQYFENKVGGDNFINYVKNNRYNL